jgi:hypothetical protein
LPAILERVDKSIAQWIVETHWIVLAIAGVVILAAIVGAALLALAAILRVWPELLDRSEERLATDARRTHGR